MFVSSTNPPADPRMEDSVNLRHGPTPAAFRAPSSISIRPSGQLTNRASGVVASNAPPAEFPNAPSPWVGRVIARSATDRSANLLSINPRPWEVGDSASHPARLLMNRSASLGRCRPIRVRRRAARAGHAGFPFYRCGLEITDASGSRRGSVLVLARYPG